MNQDNNVSDVPNEPVQEEIKEEIKEEVVEVKEVQAKSNDKEKNMWSMFCHLSAVVGYFIPFGNVIGPLVIWMIKKDEFEIVGDQGKEAINFQISCLIYLAVSAVLIVVGIGILLVIGVALFNIVMMIVASIQAYDGKRYRYPLTIKFLK